MPRKKTLEQEINDFLEYWDCKKQVEFLRDIIPLFELYDVDNEDDWIEKEIGCDEDNVRNVRLIRTVYLVSRIAEFHVGRLCTISVAFKNLWKRLENEQKNNSTNTDGSVMS